MDTYIHTYMHKYVRTCIHTYVHAYIHTYIRRDVHTWLDGWREGGREGCVCVCVYVCACVHIHIYIYVWLLEPGLVHHPLPQVDPATVSGTQHPFHLGGCYLAVSSKQRAQGRWGSRLLAWLVEGGFRANQRDKHSTESLSRTPKLIYKVEPLSPPAFLEAFWSSPLETSYF